MIKKLFVFPIIASLFSFFGINNAEIPAYETAMQRPVKKTIDALQKKYPLCPMGRGGSNNGYKIKQEFLGFEFKGKMTKERARAVLIDVVELFLKNINEDQDLAQHLDVKPFSYKNVAVQIFINNARGERVYHPDIAVVSLTQEGIVKFATDDPENPYKYKSRNTETYEEALKLVQEYYGRNHTSS